MAGDQYEATFAAVRGWVVVTSSRRVEMERLACRVRDSAPRMLLHISAK